MRWKAKEHPPKGTIRIRTFFTWVPTKIHGMVYLWEYITVEEAAYDSGGWFIHEVLRDGRGPTCSGAIRIAEDCQRVFRAWGIDA